VTGGVRSVEDGSDGAGVSVVPVLHVGSPEFDASNGGLPPCFSEGVGEFDCPAFGVVEVFLD
ncbi:hypothetical protein QP360_07465, partial [Gardnerella leopoldii]|nr:hypothetical protein [Gardnerella leopoldii]